ncbi:response regulator transcription factor [Telluribacter sp. SYSU D00476]|uniref:response regulator transcription factor n=1 Tax=Telluribacter sp. SYSU D00476 TaxID=2811430 RepID=UPI001FF31AF1|nr:helix-turn-helix transcriptional regulator [Telluribacter sp. SYSU D00476]
MKLLSGRTLWSVLTILLLISPAFGQTDTFRQLEDKVYQLNNALKYRESQALLLPVLESTSLSAEDKYQASLLLSYTYKRVLDYPSTLQFLETARQFARQTPRNDQYQAAILAQEAFVYFDIHEYEKSDRIMRAIEKTGFRHIDLENKAKIVMQQAYLLFMRKQYQEAETTYDKAIEWLRASSPCDLPMIYVKKMQLYSAMNQMDKMQEALRHSSTYADSCAIIKYDIYAYSELLTIYKNKNDIEGIAFAAKKLDTLNKIFAQAENIAALHNQKEAMMLKTKDQHLAAQKASHLYLTLLIIGLLIIVGALGVWLYLYRRQKAFMEKEIVRMSAELQSYIIQSKTSSPDLSTTSNINTNLLSERQRQVLDHLVAGLANKEIADKLCVSENTVKYHIKNIYQLFDLKDRKDLFANLNKKVGNHMHLE